MRKLLASQEIRTQQLQCQSCGDALHIENQFVKSVTCRSCGATCVISGSGGLDPQGKTVSLADYPSRLSVGARGKIKDRAFTVLGRIRYVYDEGFWEERQINWDGGAWDEADYNNSGQFVPSNTSQHQLKVSYGETSSSNMEPLTLEMVVKKNRYVQGWFWAYGGCASVLGLLFLAAGSPKTAGNLLQSFMEDD